MNVRHRPARQKPALALLLWAAVRCAAAGALLMEDFSGEPAARGWRVQGDAALFAWDAGAGELRVTWDSSRANSFFHHPLGTTLAKDDDFTLSFDVRLEDIAFGTTPGKPYTFQIAVGLHSLAQATRTNFFRGAGVHSNGPRSVVEWNYFPDAGHGATLSQVMIATNNLFRYANTFPLEFAPGSAWRVVMRYTASNGVMTTRVTSDGALLPFTNTVTLGAAFTDYRLDTLAVSSYSDAGQPGGGFAGSVLAHGAVDNFALSFPDPPAPGLSLALTNGAAEVSCVARANWVFVLERSLDLQTWEAIGPPQPGTGDVLRLRDESPPALPAFYRVRASRP